MPYGIRVGLVVLDSELVDTLAEAAIDTVLSGLSEEARTHDVAQCILKKAGERIGFRQISLKTAVDRKEVNDRCSFMRQ